MARYARSSALRGGTRRFRRRRTSNITKARWQRPSARNQKRLILTNARDIARLKSEARLGRVFTDYQINGQAVLTPGSWTFIRLTDFTGWTPVLRQNIVADNQKNATIMHQVLNTRFSMSTPGGTVLQSPQFWSFFIISPRNSSQGDPNATPFSLGDDYIVNSAVQESLVRLNPGRWKVHAYKYATLAVGAESGLPVVGLSAFQTSSTWRKHQFSLRGRKHIKNPNGNWMDHEFELLPPWQRIFIAVFVDTLNAASTPTLYYDNLSTMLTSN